MLRLYWFFVIPHDAFLIWSVSPQALSLLGIYSETKRYFDLPEAKRDILELALAWVGNLLPAAVGVAGMRVALAASHIASYVVRGRFLPFRYEQVMQARDL